MSRPILTVQPTNAYGLYQAVLTLPCGRAFTGWGLTEKSAYQSAWRKARDEAA